MNDQQDSWAARLVESITRQPDYPRARATAIRRFNWQMSDGARIVDVGEVVEGLKPDIDSVIALHWATPAD